jgi:outer membrane protein TolC
MKTIILLSFILSSNLSFAEQTKSQFVVNPETMRTQLLSNNISLQEALNHVESSKLNVNAARAKLFPSLNLGVLLPALANPSFLLSSITFLFPFLVPSNWTAVKQEANLLEADKAAYRATELNLLSNAFSLYYTHLNDLEIQNIYNDQSLAMEKLYLVLKRQSEVLGNVSAEDLQMAQAQMNDSKTAASKIQELIILEKANLRSLLALPLKTDMQIVVSEIAPSNFEDKSIQEVLDRSLLVAPEVTQLDYLVKAAENGKFSKELGFISQASIGGIANSTNSAFGNAKASGTFSFGLDTISSIELAQNNIDSIKLRQEQLKQENEKTSEVLVGQMHEMKSQLKFSSDSLEERRAVYNSQTREYQLGLISEQTLLLTESQLTNSRVAFAKSNLDYRLQRLALQRLVIDGDFAKVKSCNATVKKSEKTSEEKSFGFPWFGHKKPTVSLDDVCKN